MFDKLVESTKQKQQGRSKFYLVTSLIYGTSLSVLAVATILWFNPAMAEANTAEIMLAPPLIPMASAPMEPTPSRPTPQPQFAPPAIPPERIPNAREVPPAPQFNRTQTYVPGAEMFRDMPSGGGGPTGPGTSNDEVAPPPPAPTPKPTPTATPAPEPTPQKVVPMSSVILQGKAIRKIQPLYPHIAKQVKASGQVPVHITISEEGRVLEASVVSGHPTLREAARQAAMQWVFSPTVLNGKAVKVSGVISFNFILN